MLWLLLIISFKLFCCYIHVPNCRCNWYVAIICDKYNYVCRNPCLILMCLVHFIPFFVTIFTKWFPIFFFIIHIFFLCVSTFKYQICYLYANKCIEFKICFRISILFHSHTKVYSCSTTWFLRYWHILSSVNIVPLHLLNFKYVFTISMIYAKRCSLWVIYQS